MEWKLHPKKSFSQQKTPPEAPGPGWNGKPGVQGLRKSRSEEATKGSHRSPAFA